MNQDQQTAADHQDASTREFQLGLNMTLALDKAKDLAAYLEGLLHTAGYIGPVAVAGGYVRDMALGKDHKDRDVFLDGGYIQDIDHLKRILALFTDQLGQAATVGRVIDAQYGEWATDVRWVVPIENPGLGKAGLDLVVLHRDELMKASYTPNAILQADTRASFLDAVLRRVDVRLNAIGASATGSATRGMWKHDALARRLVVQDSRRTEDPERIARRLQRMTEKGAKYEGWEICGEGTHGELVPFDTPS